MCASLSSAGSSLRDDTPHTTNTRGLLVLPRHACDARVQTTDAVLFEISALVVGVSSSSFESHQGGEEGGLWVDGVGMVFGRMSVCVSWVVCVYVMGVLIRISCVLRRAR